MQHFDFVSHFFPHHDLDTESFNALNASTLILSTEEEKIHLTPFTSYKKIFYEMCHKVGKNGELVRIINIFALVE